MFCSVVGSLRVVERAGGLCGREKARQLIRALLLGKGRRWVVRGVVWLMSFRFAALWSS